MSERPVRVRSVAPEGGRVMVRQSLAADQDVHNILKRYVTTGALPVAGRSPSYGDFVSDVDYHGAWNRVRAAEQSFASLPSDVRAHCKNDPAEFLKMVFDPSRRDELEQLGLVDGKLEAALPDAARAVQEDAKAKAAESTVNAP